VRPTTVKSRLLKVQVTESQFSDDLALYTVTEQLLNQLVEDL